MTFLASFLPQTLIINGNNDVSSTAPPSPPPPLLRSDFIIPRHCCAFSPGDLRDEIRLARCCWSSTPLVTLGDSLLAPQRRRRRRRRLQQQLPSISSTLCLALSSPGTKQRTEQSALAFGPLHIIILPPLSLSLSLSPFMSQRPSSSPSK